MYNVDQMKALVLAAGAGYIGTLLKGIPQSIINALLYLNGYTISFSSNEISITSLVTAYMSIYKEYKKKRRISRKNINITGKVLPVDNYLLPVFTSKFYKDLGVKVVGEESIVLPGLPKYFTIMVDTLTFMRVNIISKRYEITSGNGNPHENVEHNITVEIYGLKSKQAYKRFVNQIEEFNKEYRKSLEESNNDIIGDKILVSGMNINRRYFDSIFVDNKDELINDIAGVLKSYEKCKKFNRPFILSILLYGEPGTGKTSITKSLLSNLASSATQVDEIDTVSIDNFLSNVSNDERICVFPHRSNIIHDKREIPTDIYFGKIFTFEEIDFTLGVNREKEKLDEKNKSSDRLKRMLVTMDGTTTRDGLAIVATTNHIENIDPALRRRFNVCLEIKSIHKDETLREMLKYYNIEEFYEEVCEKFDFPNKPINQAMLTNYIFNKL